MSESTGIVTMRVADLPTSLAEGERGYYCSKCSAEVWLSGHALHLMRTGQGQPICNRCIEGTIESPDDVPYPTPAQVARVNEIRARHGQGPPVDAEYIRQIAMKHLLKRRTDA